MIGGGKTFTRHTQTHQADAPTQIFAQTDKRLCRRKMTDHNEVRLRELGFDVNLQRASTDTGQCDFDHTFLWGLSHFLGWAKSEEPRSAVLQGLLCLAPYRWFSATSADPTGENTIIGDDRFCTCFGGSRFFRAHHRCNDKWMTILTQCLNLIVEISLHFLFSLKSKFISRLRAKMQ